MPKSQPFIQFRAKSGRSLIYTQPLPQRSGDVLYSPFGERYFELFLPSTTDGDASYHELVVNDIYNGHTGVLQFHNGIITYNDEYYVQRDSSPGKIEIIELPDMRLPVYLCEKPDHSFVYLSMNPFRPTPDHYKLFAVRLGNPSMVQVPIPPPIIAEDGTITIKSAVYSIELPSKLRIQRNLAAYPVWHDVNSKPIPLRRLNPNEYNIVEYEDQLSITKKQ